MEYLGKKLSKANVPWGQVKTLGDYLKSPHARRSMVNASIKNKRILVPKVPINFPEQKYKINRVMPALGENNNIILQKFLGLSLKKIKALEKDKIINKK